MSCECVCKAPRCLSTAGEMRSVRGHLQRVDAKGRSQPPAGPNSRTLGRRKGFRVPGSVLGIHPEPTLKTEDARLHQPWRSNRAKMQAVNRKAFAMLVFNYWHFQRCKSVLSTQQEKMHLDFALTQLVSSDQGLSELWDDEQAVNKVELHCCWMKDTTTVFTYTLKLWINKMEENKIPSQAKPLIFLYILTATDQHLNVKFLQWLHPPEKYECISNIKPPKIYLQMWAILSLLTKVLYINQSTFKIWGKKLLIRMTELAALKPWTP